MNKNPHLPRIRKVEAELMELKALYRDPKEQPPSGRTLIGLSRAKLLATILYSATADYRGRVHKHGWTLEQQKEFLAKFNETALKPAEAIAA